MFVFSRLLGTAVAIQFVSCLGGRQELHVFEDDEAILLQVSGELQHRGDEGHCKDDFPYVKPDNANICYRDIVSRDMASAKYPKGYWGKDGVCQGQVCEVVDGVALEITDATNRPIWAADPQCRITRCPWTLVPRVRLQGRLGDESMRLCSDPRASPAATDMETAFKVFAKTCGPDMGVPVPSHGAPIDQVRDALRAQEVNFTEIFSMVVQYREVTGVEPEETIDVGGGVTLYRVRPTGGAARVPHVLHLHGGGMAMFSAADPIFRWWRKLLASQGVAVVGVQFRNSAGKLGPKPYPAGLDDVRAAMDYVHDRRSDWGIASIVISGESGGGTLALAAALRAKREGQLDRVNGVYASSPLVADPVLREGRELLSMRENEGYLLSTGSYLLRARAYDPDSAHSADAECWPLRADRELLTGLPPHVISVNELDSLRDEGILYGKNLAAAGVSVYPKTLAGTWHTSEFWPVDRNMYVAGATAREIADFAKSL